MNIDSAPAWVWLAFAVGLGCTQSLQVGMLGAMGRLRGPAEASWLSILGTLALMNAALAVAALSGRPPALPPVVANPIVTGAVALFATGLILLALPGIPWWFALTGLLAGPYLLAAAFLAPRLGVGPFMAAIITGQLVGGIALDHVGAFGTTPRPIDAMRLLGVAALLVGLLLIRGRR